MFGFGGGIHPVMIGSLGGCDGALMIDGGSPVVIGGGSPLILGGGALMIDDGSGVIFGGGSPLIIGGGGLTIHGGSPLIPRGSLGFRRPDDDRDLERQLRLLLRSPRQDRQRRLEEGQQVRLYHQTDRAAADKILQSQRMARGSSGLAGGGIYFAESVSDTYRKAQSKGVVLSATVKLGKPKRLGSSGDCAVSYSSLQDEGYDSVIVDRPGGTEYVVYNWDQVSNIREQ